MPGGSATTAERRILFIAYHYPPVRSGGVERSIKFERYLPEYGYRARILTTSAFGRCTTSEDPYESAVVRAWEPVGLYRRLKHPEAPGRTPPSYVRTDPGCWRRARNFLSRRLLIPDGQITWLPHAFIAALRVVRQEPVSALYTSFPPASAHLLGLAVKRLTGLPWVADFRDSWIYDPLDPELNELPFRRYIEKRLEQRVVQSADVVVAATSVAADSLRSRYPDRAESIHVITNGFDPEDFAGIHVSPTRPRSGPMSLVHAGSFTASHPHRSLEPVLTALDILRSRDTAWTQRIRLTLAGYLTNQEQAAACEAAGTGMVALAGALPRRQALELEAGADVLVLVDHPRPWLASNVPGKFYEYLALRRPVLAICGPGMVRDLVCNLGAGCWAPVDDPHAIADTLARLHTQYTAGNLPASPAAAALAPFHRRQLAASLAACFDRCIASPEHPA